MGKIHRGIGGAALLLFALSVNAAAQNWRYDLGVDVGGAFRTASLGSDQITGGADNMKFAPGVFGDAQLGVRLFPRVGIRANGAFSPSNKFKQGSTTLADGIKLWSASGDLLFRLKEPPAQFTATEVLPYIALGVGARWVQPKNDLNGPLFGDTVHSGVRVASGSQLFLLRQKPVLMGLAGIGADVRVQKGLAVRLEAGDRFFKTPMDLLSSPNTVSESGIGKLTHEIYASVGLHLLGGFPKVAPVAVAPPPPTPAPTPTPTEPPPAPTPPPPPPPQPVSVCVVDNTNAQGMQMVSATFTPATGDTMVTAAAGQQKLTDAYADRAVVGSRDWYVKGQPLALGSAKFMTSGTPQAFQPGQVVYLGQLDGLAVYADPTEAAGLVKALGTTAGPNANLATAVRKAAVARQLRTVKTVYVPARAAGCQLQPLQRQEEVRKVRG